MPEMSPVAEFDFIIVGAGSAGCLLANRLSANPDHRVLLVEAGGKDNWFWIKVPVGYLYTIANPRTDWCFTTEADPGLAGRSIHYARGRVIGGSSSINAMIHMRGQASDYDLWAQATGDERWLWGGPDGTGETTASTGLITMRTIASLVSSLYPTPAAPWWPPPGSRCPSPRPSCCG